MSEVTPPDPDYDFITVRRVNYLAPHTTNERIRTKSETLTPIRIPEPFTSFLNSTLTLPTPLDPST